MTVDGEIDGGWMDGQMMDEWMDGQMMDEWVDGQQNGGCKMYGAFFTFLHMCNQALNQCF